MDNTPPKPASPVVAITKPEPSLFRPAMREIGLGLLKVAVFVSVWYAVRALWIFTKHDLMLDDFHLIVTMTIIVHLVTFWVPGAILAYFDITQWPARLYKYKIQPKRVVGVAGHAKAAWVVLLNQMLIACPLQFFVYPILVMAGCSTSAELPSGPVVLRDLLISIAIEEVLFYYSHRLLHWGPFYGYIHKMHHDFKAPIGIAAEYAHPIEFLFSNVGPVMLGPLVTGCHTITMWFWISLAILSTVHSHSGYAFPGTPFKPATMHDFHHSSFGSNYGALGVLDWLHGTDKPFKLALLKRQQAAEKQAAANGGAVSAAAVMQTTPEEDAITGKEL